MNNSTIIKIVTLSVLTLLIMFSPLNQARAADVRLSIGFASPGYVHHYYAYPSYSITYYGYHYRPDFRRHPGFYYRDRDDFYREHRWYREHHHYRDHDRGYYHHYRD